MKDVTWEEKIQIAQWGNSGTDEGQAAIRNFIIERIEDLDVQTTSMLLNSVEITPKAFLENPEAYLKLQEKYISFGDDKFGASEYIRVNVYLTTLKDAYENGRLIIE